MRKPMAALVLPLALAGACGGSDPSPEQQIRQAVHEVIEAIEAKEPQHLLRHVAFDYRGDNGLEYADVQSLVLAFLLREGTPLATLETLHVEKADAGGRHRVRMQVSFGQGSPGSDLVPADRATSYAFDLTFARGEEHWQAVAGSYRRR